MTTLNKSETLILAKDMAEVHAVMPEAIQKSDLDAFGAKTPGFAGSVKSELRRQSSTRSSCP